MSMISILQRLDATKITSHVSVQKVTNKKIFVVLPYVVIGGGLALNDTGFILVQTTCPTSSLSRSVTLFLSPGARSLQWGYKREGERWGVQEGRSAPAGRAERTGAPL